MQTPDQIVEKTEEEEDNQDESPTKRHAFVA